MPSSTSRHCRTRQAQSQLLLLFFLGRIALLAGLAFFGSLDAALVSAFFTIGFGFFAAGFGASDSDAGQECHGAKHSRECLNRLHVFPLSRPVPAPSQAPACLL